MTPRSDPSSDPPRSGFLARIGNQVFHFRDALVPIVFVALMLASGPRNYVGSERFGRFLDFAGLGVALLGQTLRAVVIGLAYIRRGGKNRTIYADDLVVEGFFAHSRNPLYLGNLLVLLGLFLILNSVPGYVVGIPFFAFVYAAIIAAEEDYLGRRFGAPYREYCSQVPRLWPRWSGLGATMRSMRFDWRRLVRSEYGATFAWVTAALAMMALESVQRHGLSASRPRLMGIGALWLAVLVAYGTVRFLKKTRRLAS